MWKAVGSHLATDVFRAGGQMLGQHFALGDERFGPHLFQVPYLVSIQLHDTIYRVIVK